MVGQGEAHQRAMRGPIRELERMIVSVELRQSLARVGDAKSGAISLWRLL